MMAEVVWERNISLWGFTFAAAKYGDGAWYVSFSWKLD